MKRALTAALLLALAAPLASANGRAESVETAVARQVREILDDLAGTDMTAVRVAVELADQPVAGRQVNGEIRDLLGSGGIQRLRVELTVDPIKQVWDTAGGSVAEVERPDDEAARLAVLAEKVAGVNRALGDQVILESASLAEVRLANREKANVALRLAQEEQRRQLWTNIGLNIGKIVAIVAALVLLRHALRFIGRRFGP